MDLKKLDHAIEETERFLSRAKALRKSIATEDARVAAAKRNDPKGWHFTSSFPAQSGAVRRASMDLTRALANLRRYSS